MSATRSLRARLACGLAVGSGFLTIPLNGLLVLLAFAAGDLGTTGNVLMEQSGAWIGNSVAFVGGTAALALGWLHRRDIEVRGVEPVDAGLARAAEILGVCVAFLAAFLLLGTAQYHWPF